MTNPTNPKDIDCTTGSNIVEHPDKELIKTYADQIDGSDYLIDRPGFSLIIVTDEIPTYSMLIKKLESLVAELKEKYS